MSPAIVREPMKSTAARTTESTGIISMACCNPIALKASVTMAEPAGSAGACVRMSVALMDNPITQPAREQASGDAACRVGDARADARSGETDVMNAAQIGGHEETERVHVEVERGSGSNDPPERGDTQHGPGGTIVGGT